MFKTTLATVVATLAVPLVLGGCTFEGGYGDDDLQESLHSRLGTREALTLESTSLVGVAAYDGAGEPQPCLQPSVGGGRAVLRSTDTGLLLVEALDIELTDVTVGPGVVYSQPIELTDIELRLGTQIAIEADWSDDGKVAEGTGRADLLMDWAVRDDDGDILPLATQKLRQVEFAVKAYETDDGAIRAQVISAVDGRFGGFADRIELSDFSMAVNASTRFDVE